MLFPQGILPLLALAFVTFTWLCRWVATGKPTVLTGLEVPIFLLLGLALVGWGISVNPHTSYNRFWSLMAGLVTFYGVANYVSNRRTVRMVAVGLAVLTLAIAAFSLVGVDWRNARLLDPWGFYRYMPVLIDGLPHSGVGAAVGLVNPRWLGMALGLLLPVLLPLAFSTTDRPLRWLSALAVVAGIFVLVLSQSIQGLAGFLAGVFFLLVWRSRWFALFVPVGLVALVVFVILMGPSQLAGSLLTLDSWLGKSAVLRIDMQSRALAMIADVPFTGIGLNTFPFIQSHFYTGYSIGPEPTAHNLYLQAALDFGLPGLIIFLWLLGAWFVILRRNYRRAVDPGYRLLLVGLAAGVVAYLGHGFFDAVMLGSKVGPALWALLGAGVAVPAAAGTNGQEKDNPGVDDFRLPAPFYQLLGALGLLALAAILNPVSVFMNLGAAGAHTGIYQARQTGVIPVELLLRAERDLATVVSRQPARASAHDLLGSVYAWTGRYERALQAFSTRVELDGDNPYAHYYPPEAWLRQINGIAPAEGGNWDDLISIYSRWMHRYPTVAENYLRVALVWEQHKNDPRRAIQSLQSGLSHDAQPAGLLHYYLDQLESPPP